MHKHSKLEQISQTEGESSNSSSNKKERHLSLLRKPGKEKISQYIKHNLELPRRHGGSNIMRVESKIFQGLHLQCEIYNNGIIPRENNMAKQHQFEAASELVFWYRTGVE